MRELVLQALCNWILRVTDENTKATTEEIVALPEVARVLFTSEYFTRS